MVQTRVCVVGAGATGLCAARHLATPGSGVTAIVYEQTDCVGGTWVYTENTDVDPRTGLPVHSAMYKSLWTNLPKDLMGFPDFPMQSKERSYLPADDVLSFLNLYADHFNLRSHIKFHHHVKRVEPLDKGWRVTVTDLLNKQDVTEIFDAVLVCNGHYHTPCLPTIPGMETFPGLQLHSHAYRVPDPMAGNTVVVMGAGPSGLDLAVEISKVAKQVILSHHVRGETLSQFPDNIIQKPDIRNISGSSVTFQDDTKVQADVLFYCTGYKYSFPFLSPECGITVEDNCVQPLYKHLVHVYRPSIFFMGLPFLVVTFTLFDIQARYILGLLTGKFSLPSTTDMLKHSEMELADHKARGLRLRRFHGIGLRQTEYYDSLTNEAGLPRTPPVLAAIHTYICDQLFQGVSDFRKDVFCLVDDFTFRKIE